MRLTTPVLVAGLVAALIAPRPVDAQTGSRYDASSFDPDEMFRNVPPKPAAGGYRSQSSAPSRPSQPATPPATGLHTIPKPPAAKPLAPAPKPTAAPARPSASTLDLPPVPAKPRTRTTPPRPTAPVARPASRDPFGSAPARPAPAATPPSRPQRDTASSSLSFDFDTPPRPATTPSRPAAPKPLSAASTLSARDAFATQPSRPSRPATPPAPTSRPTRPITPERSLATPSRTNPREMDASETATHKMLAKMLRRPASSQLTGASTSLAEVIATAGSREDQARRVDAYWALTSAVADYYLGLYEQSELTKLRNEVATFSRPLGAAQQKLATRVGTSLKAARSAQYRLARLIGTASMPLPTDVPFTGRYQTRLGDMFPGGAPAEARLLDELLPLRLAELRDAADDLAATEDWVERVRKDPASRKSAEGVIKALKLNALNRRAFVQLARDYNLQINRYTQLAKPEPVDTGRLVAMLIRERPLLAQAPGGSNSANQNFRSGASPRR